MVRHYKRTSNRGGYGNDALRDALQALDNGGTLKGVARRYGVPARTLRRHRDKKVLQPGQSVLGRKAVLPLQFEQEHVYHIKAMERALFGLTSFDVRRLAYDLAVASNFEHPFNKSAKMAGVDWLQGFMARHKELSIRTPQATSIMRATGFNRVKTDQFYKVYGEELAKIPNLTPNRIWNVDETGIQNVHVPCKIIASKGVKQVSKVTSGERGINVTAVCAMSASGMYVPPMLIFPRKRMNDNLIKGAPPGSIGKVSDSEWIDSDLFIDWLNHFIKHAGCTRENPHILILDGHNSHKTLNAVTLARAKGLVMITLPPHCSHKMQPLDRTFFKSLKSNYNRIVDSWMSAHPGGRVTVYEMGYLFGSAYTKSATMDKAAKGFECTGIWPFDPDHFDDEDFLSAAATDQEPPNVVDKEDRTVMITDEGLINTTLSSIPTSSLAPSTSSSRPIPAAPSSTPASMSRKLATSSSTPAPCSSAPAPSSSTPAPSSSALWSSASAPSSSVLTPSSLAHASLSSAPWSSASSPSSSTTAPSSSATAPSYSGTAPSSSATAPSSSGTAPSSSATAPSSSGTAPSSSATAPSSSASVMSSSTPAPSKSTSSSSTCAPSSTSAPSISFSRPISVAYSSKPASIPSSSKTSVASTSNPTSTQKLLSVESTSSCFPRSVAQNSLVYRASNKTKPAVIISQLSPMPKVKTSAPRKRKAESSTVLTSSPYKIVLEEKEERKSKSSKKSTQKTQPKKNSKPVNMVTTDDAECIYCTELFSMSNEDWIQCINCRGWAHVGCAGITATDISFTCDFCED